MTIESKSVPYRQTQSLLSTLKEKFQTGFFPVLTQDIINLAQSTQRFFCHNFLYFFHGVVFLFIVLTIRKTADVTPFVFLESNNTSFLRAFIHPRLLWLALPPGWFLLSCMAWFYGKNKKQAGVRTAALSSLFASFAACVFILLVLLLTKTSILYSALFSTCAIASSLAAAMVYLLALHFFRIPICLYGLCIAFCAAWPHSLSPPLLMLGIGAGLGWGIALGGPLYQPSKNRKSLKWPLPHAHRFSNRIHFHLLISSTAKVCSEIRNDVYILTARAYTSARNYGYVIFHGFSFVLILSIIGFPHDARLIGWFQFPQTGFLHDLAQFFSHWGDFPTGCLLFCLFCWITGYIRRKRIWRQIAIACLMASLLAGATTQVTKHVLGRARPHQEQQQGFYFLHPDANFHSFPSGHTAASVALAAAVAVIAPELSLPAILWGGGVGWSRIQMNSHFPTDVFAGACIGILFGALFGRAVQRQHYSLRKTASSLTQLARARLTPE